MRMDIKRKWARALRAGRYPRYRYSPLGVLCALYQQEHNVRFIYMHHTQLITPSDLPDEVVQWAELGDSPLIYGVQQMWNGRLSFAEIADYIEAKA